MKRLISAMLAIGLIIGLLSVHASAEQVDEAMGGLLNTAVMTASDDNYYEELEPNDDLMNSNLIEHGYTVYGTLSGEDLDIYIFELGETSVVSVFTRTTTDTLTFALYNCETGNWEWESNYFGIEPETGLHIVNMDANGISPGIYCLVFWENSYADSEYEFFVSMPGNLVCLHEYDEGVVTREQTCVEDGIKIVTCYWCGYQAEEVTYAPGHDFVGGKCSVCGAKPTDVIVEGLHEHGLAKWKLTEDGTLTISGKGILQNKTEYEWNGYAHLIKKVVIEDGVKSVSNKAFYQYPKLTQVVLGKTVAYIGESAFLGCEKLTSINIPASLTEIQEHAFYGCTSLQEIHYPSDSKLTTIGKGAFGSTGLLKVCLPAGMTVIPEYVFAGCTNMEEIIVPEGIVKVDFHAFEGCTGAKTLSLPSTVSDIRNYAFDGCNNIEKFICNSSASFTPKYQNSLKIAEFGDQVTAVPSSAFYECTKLEQVFLTDKITIIGRDAFGGCTSLTSIDIPNSVTSIAAWAFAGSGLQEVTIPDSITEMGNSVFQGCANLSEVTLGKNISAITSGTFDGCASLKQINLNRVTEIGFEAFKGCASLENVDLSNVENIRYYAFQNCTALKQLTFSRDLKEIEFFAFWGCTALERIYFTGDAPTFGADCFKNVTCDAYYPLGNSTWTEEVRQNYGGQINWIGVEVLPEAEVAVARMILGNELAMQFAFPKTSIVEGVEYVVSVTKTYADGREDKNILVPMDQWGTNGPYYYVSFNGIAAKEMGDTINTQILTADGVAVGGVYTDSVQAYAVRQLRKTTDAKTRTLYVDMLNYGAAAQTYFKYDAANLVTKGLTETEKSYGTKSVKLENNLLKGTGYVASQLDLGSSILLRVKFNGIDASMHAVVSFTNHMGAQKDVTISGSEFISGGTVVVIDDVVAADYDRDVTITVYDADGNVVANAVESVASYLARQLEKPNPLAIYDAVAKYCAAAYGYLHK